MIYIKPDQRMRLYKEAQEIIYKREQRFICTTLQGILKRRFGCRIPLSEIPDHFPELKRRIPINKVSRYMVLIECEKESEYATD